MTTKEYNSLSTVISKKCKLNTHKLRLQSSDIKTNNAKPSHKNIEDKKKLQV
jgi:hypothetical protein